MVQQQKTPLKIGTTKVFRKDMEKLAKQQGGEKSIKALKDVMNIIVNQEELPEQHNFHKLHGEYAKYLTCHVRNDVCLIWKIEGDTAEFYRVGSHSELY